ncbi:MAG: haloacid dehalogenase type II, partial [Bacteroidota bacterium]
MKIDQVSTKKCFVFDAFGTLFKTTEVQAALTKIAGNKTDSLLNVWRSKQLQYTWLRNAMKQYAPFSTVTREALDYSMRLHGITDEKVFDILLPLYDTPQLIDGAKDLLKTLKAQGKTVAILSNGTRSMLDNGVQLTGVQFYVDHILSVDDIGIYKPDPAVYQMALERLGATTDELIFFSSNQWDVSGASTFGLDACWINQYGEVREELPFGMVVEVGSLSELA